MPAAFDLTVYRQYPDGRCTSGYLAVNGEIVCYTLERPWLDNRPFVSSVPAGTYAAKLRYDHADNWRVELLDVPGRDYVQFHVGNEPDETEGCILVGERLGPDLCTLQGSAAAYTMLKRAFYGSDNPSSTPDKEITVTIVDAGRAT